MSKKSFKELSHCERMKNDSLECKPKEIEPKKIYVEVVESFKDDLTGKVLQRLVKKEIDKTKEFAEYVVSDFSLENLTAAGVKMNLVNLRGDSMNVIDNTVNVLDKLDNINISEDK